MKQKTEKIRQVEPGYGWMNRILRIDLSAMEARAQDSSEFVPDFLG